MTIFVFLMFISSPIFLQKSDKMDILFWSDMGSNARRTKSSAQRRWEMITLLSSGYVESDKIKEDNSWMNSLNKSGDKGWPCSVP